MRTDQATHDHYASNARFAGHAIDCALVAGSWFTVDGVGVNWPTMLGKPACTCDRHTHGRQAHSHPDSDHPHADWSAMGAAEKETTR